MLADDGVGDDQLAVSNHKASERIQDDDEPFHHGRHRLGQSVQRPGVMYKTDCRILNKNIINNSSSSREYQHRAASVIGISKPIIAKSVLFIVAKPSDDGSEITCIATNPLIPSHGELNEPNPTTEGSCSFQGLISVLFGACGFLYCLIMQSCNNAH